ncbi:MAG: segregation/condensation protein A, partial [Casimicrobiaceae bacterium]
ATVRVWFERVAATRMPDVAADDLKAAWAMLISRAHANRHHRVTREQLSVRAEMSRVLKALPGGRFVEFVELFAPHADVAHLVVTFLALLELAREQMIDIAQAQAYAPIYVNARGERAFVLASDA